MSMYFYVLLILLNLTSTAGTQNKSEDNDKINSYLIQHFPPFDIYFSILIGSIILNSYITVILFKSDKIIDRMVKIQCILMVLYVPVSVLTHFFCVEFGKIYPSHIEILCYIKSVTPLFVLGLSRCIFSLIAFVRYAYVFFPIKCKILGENKILCIAIIVCFLVSLARSISEILTIYIFNGFTSFIFITCHGTIDEEFQILAIPLHLLLMILSIGFYSRILIFMKYQKFKKLMRRVNMISIYTNFLITISFFICKSAIFINFAIFEGNRSNRYAVVIICETTVIPIMYFIFSPEIRKQHWVFISIVKSKLCLSENSVNPMVINVRPIQTENNINLPSLPTISQAVS